MDEEDDEKETDTGTEDNDDNSGDDEDTGKEDNDETETGGDNTNVLKFRFNATIQEYSLSQKSDVGNSVVGDVDAHDDDIGNSVVGAVDAHDDDTMTRQHLVHKIHLT